MYAGMSRVGVAAESLARVGKHWERFRGRSEENASSHPPLDRKRGTEALVWDRMTAVGATGVTWQERRSAE